VHDPISILLALAALTFLVGAALGVNHLRAGAARPATLAFIAGAALLALLIGITFLFPATDVRLLLLAIFALCSGGLLLTLALQKKSGESPAPSALQTLAVTSSSPALIVTDREGIILEWSRAAEALFGYAASKMKGTRNIPGLCPPPVGEADDPLSGMITLCLETGQKQVRALQALAANGECPWVQFTVLPQYAKHGPPPGALLLAEDITDRMEKEEWLRDRAASFRELAESISDMFFAFDADARCTYWNRASETIFGVSERDAVGKEVRELFGARASSGIDEFCLRGLHTHEHDVYTTEIETGTETGTEKRTFEISTYPTKTGISVFGRDVTWRKQAYDQLLYQSNILKNVLNSVIVTDLDGRITYWNHIAARTFGYHYEELQGKSAALIYPDQDERRYLADVAETASGIDWVGEWEGRKKDGSPVWVDFKRTLMRNGEGNPIGIVGVSVDITERNRPNGSSKKARRNTGNSAKASATSSLRSTATFASPIGTRRRKFSPERHAPLRRGNNYGRCSPILPPPTSFSVTTKLFGPRCRRRLRRASPWGATRWYSRQAPTRRGPASLSLSATSPSGSARCSPFAKANGRNVRS
jgi:PAS domain S-box-containing protein